MMNLDLSLRLSLSFEIFRNSKMDSEKSIFVDFGKMCLLAIVARKSVQGTGIMAKMGLRPETCPVFLATIESKHILAKNGPFGPFLTKIGYTYAGKMRTFS